MTAATFFCAALLAGCNFSSGSAPSLAQSAGSSAQSAAATKIDQGSICEVSGWRRDVVAKACRPGQKVVFLPESWGNEQLPIYFAAVNCDLRYQVALTKGGVICIYQPLDPPAPAAPATAPATPASTTGAPTSS